MGIFHYPVFQPALNNGSPVFDPGVPRGHSRLSDGVHVIPWPWLTGYIKVTASWTGGSSGPPVAPITTASVNDINRYTGIIDGVYKG